MLIESFSGIRGIYSDSLTHDVAEKYALLFLDFIRKRCRKPVIVIGKDSRPSSEILKNYVIEAMNAHIIDVGFASTPAVEFGVRHFKADGGIVITASHNEPYWNGFKFLQSDGSILSQPDMENIISGYHKLMHEPLDKVYKKFSPKVKRCVEERNNELMHAYSGFVLSYVKKDISAIKKSGIKVVIDPNGGTGIIAKDILEKAGLKVFAVNTDYGIFNRKVEPDFDSLFYLANIAKECNASFAAGFDCDADRLNIILPEGRLVSGHYLLALIADEMLKSGIKKVIVANNATSGILAEIAKKHKAKLIEVDAGETNVVEAMKKCNAAVGGEGSSGGVIIAPSKCRDGVITLLMTVKIVANLGTGLGRIIDSYPKYYTLSRKITFDDKDPSSIKKQIEKHYLSAGRKVINQNAYRGSIKVTIDNESFVWFRDSKTEGNVFRIIADSKSGEKTGKILAEAVDVFNKAIK